MKFVFMDLSRRPERQGKRRTLHPLFVMKFGISALKNKTKMSILM
jgi:hypothetical protein